MTLAHPPSRPSLAALRAHIRALERPGEDAAPVVSVGAAALDTALPWGGLPCGRMHQVTGGGDGFCGPLIAFTARLAARLSHRRPGRGTVLWVVAAGTVDDTLYGPGLAAHGLTPDRLLIARARDDADVLWCLEEGLRCPTLAAVVGQARVVDLSAGRRLQLAAEQSGTTGLLLPSGHGAGWRAAADASPAATGATTRWRIETAPAAPAPWGPRGLGRSRWTVTLERCQGGLPRSWLVECDDASGDLSVVSELDDGQADPAGGPLRRQA